MKRISSARTLLAASGIALLFTACEPARENIVDTVEPLETSTDAVKDAPGTEHEAPPATATETATETAPQPATRTQ
ncbi:MAG TPA: hypothetical protein VLV48_04485 [Thermoanaerobaculia bacterium]|nr:hypothetical protein [Thermoanaerobaculia bacterium]